MEIKEKCLNSVLLQFPLGSPCLQDQTVTDIGSLLECECVPSPIKNVALLE